MHAEALIPKAAKLFPRLTKFKNFYLAGGTALALQIGHRVSVDFDMFSFQPLPDRLLQKIKQVFTGAKVEVTYNVPGQLDLIIDEIKCTFFTFEYPLVKPLVKYKKVLLAAKKEIAIMKALAIGKRLSYKDYVDWYFLLKEKHVNLAEVIKLAKLKFGSDFSDRLFLGQLVSLADIKTQKIDFLRDPVDSQTIEKFLQQTVWKFKL